MELLNLFSLIDDLNEDVNEDIYTGLKNKMVRTVIDTRTTLINAGDSIEYFYYLAKGNAWGVDNHGATAWFCEENEILIFDTSLINDTPSIFQIVVEKGSILHRISKTDLFKIDEKRNIENILKNHLIANLSYFMGLSIDLKCLKLKIK